MSQVTNRPLEARVDKKYVDGSYRWMNVTVAKCHSRLFVGRMISVGQIVAWSVCGWTDRQDTSRGHVYVLVRGGRGYQSWNMKNIYYEWIKY